MNGPLPPDPRRIPESGTTPLPPVPPGPIHGSRHGNGGTRRNLGAVYTLCLTVLILGALIVLGLPNVPKAATVLALVIGAGSAGILLGHTLRIEVDGREVRAKGVQRVPSQQLPHEHDQRRQE